MARAEETRQRQKSHAKRISRICAGATIQTITLIFAHRWISPMQSTVQILAPIGFQVS
jgi:hypothetical protein